MPIPADIDLGWRVDEPKLWAIDLPVEEINIQEIIHNRDIPYLEKKGTTERNMSPRLLLEDFDNQKPHADTVREVDLNYPIQLYYHNNKRIIIDGVHRFTRALWLGHETIKVRRVPEEIVPLIKKSDEDFRKWKGEL